MENWRLNRFYLLLLVSTELCALPQLNAETRSSFLPFEEVVAAYRSSDTLLVDRNGEPLYEIRVDKNSRKLPWVALGEISPILISAVVDAEDRRFMSHSGTDYRAVAASLAGNLISSFKSLTSDSDESEDVSRRGASTITMQVAAQLRADLRPSKGRRSFLQKYRQSLAADDLEKYWSKNQILEAYLNLIPFRGESRGIGAASWNLFSKAPSGLSLDEARLLSALIRAPNASPKVVARRTAAILAASHRASEWTEDSVGAVFLTAKGIQRFHELAPHVARLAIQFYGEGEGALPDRMHSTLDADLQRETESVLSRNIHSLAHRNVTDGAVLVVENATGKVLAYVGHVNQSSGTTHIDGIRAARQAGSTLKPFIYASAFERRVLTPTSILEDTPLAIQSATGIYSPQNYDRTFSGDVEARVALASSLNIPAIRALLLIGVDSFRGTLESLGFQNLREGEFYGPALALGAVDVTLWDLVGAYRSLARQGLFGPMTLFPNADSAGSASSASPAISMPKITRVLSKEAVFMTADILADRGARSSTFGLENNMSLPYWAAVKTGTSKDMRDNWCIGFTSEYTVGVWVGNFSGSSMWDVSGVDGAAPVWRSVMNLLHRDRPSKSDHSGPVAPSGVVKLEYPLAHSGAISSSWYLKGTGFGKALEDFEMLPARITYPPDGAILAVDPDIPLSKQRVEFKVSSASASRRQYNLFVNGVALVDGVSDGRWQIQRGNHFAEVRSADGALLDSVKFQVR